MLRTATPTPTAVIRFDNTPCTNAIKFGCLKLSGLIQGAQGIHIDTYIRTPRGDIAGSIRQREDIL